MKSKLFSPIRVLLLALVSLNSCAQSSDAKYKSPKNYDLTQPKAEPLWDALHEISAIGFWGDTLIAVEDENGIIYKFTPFSKKLEQTQFAPTGDYEGIAIANDFVVVLRSDGTLFSIPKKELSKEKTNLAREWNSLLPKGEYESLAYNAKDALLYAVCKSCSVDKKSDKTSGYKLSLSREGEIKKVGEFTLEHSLLDSFSSLKGKKFRPSALGQNPKTGEWYLLSSVNQMLVVLDDKMSPKAAYALDPKLYNQPEGLAFDKDGALFISNEGGSKTSRPSLLKFNLIP
ncbi:SdiA-regulated domain-containing protein [Chryseobacterium sp. A321]